MDPTSPHFTPKSPAHVSKNAVPLPVRHVQSHPLSRETSASGGSARPQTPKRVLNCIIDDTALVQGAKESTRDGFRKWVAKGQMRLFVPLYALAQTAKLKDKAGKQAKDAEEALVWLDNATSDHPQLVTLQGGFDQFEKWSDVERYLLPKSLFSESLSNGNPSVVDMSVNKTAKRSEPLNSVSLDESANPVATAQTSDSPQSSPQLAKPTPSTTAMDTDVPVALRPLINYILWRIHQERNPSAALQSFIFLTDDPVKQKCAQRFGIRSKTLQEIRGIIAREGQASRTYKKDAIMPYQPISRQAGAQSPAASVPFTSPPVLEGSPAISSEPIGVQDSVSANGDLPSDEDEVVLKRNPFPDQAYETIIDPNQFTRNPVSTSRAAGPDTTPRGTSRRGQPRGTPRRTASPRGRASSGRGQRAGQPQGGQGQGQGQGQTQSPLPGSTPVGTRLTRQQLKSLHSTPISEDNPIDPDSFSRPTPPKAGPARGTPRLWNPV